MISEIEEKKKIFVTAVDTSGELWRNKSERMRTQRKVE